MKIPASIRDVFDVQYEPNVRLKNRVDELMKGKKRDRWHYESRIKTPLSFALKLESGRVPNPAEMEDFFAATIVVPNATEIVVAEKMVRDCFSVKERRPPDNGSTHKAPEEFPFDDLRLYIKLAQDLTTPPNGLEHILFEVQIKTFLQHAWSIATHDLIYKSNEASWSKSRIAFQIKAMLEHAEISILEAEHLATTRALAIQDRHSLDLQSLIDLIKQQWEIEELPDNVKRLAQNVNQIMCALGLTRYQMESILNLGKSANGDAHPSNLSPYATIVSYLLTQLPDRMRTALSEAKSKLRVVIPREVTLPQGMQRTDFKKAIFVD